MEPFLQVKNLTTGIQKNNNFLPLIKNINFELYRGKTFALLGESGSGKSITALSIMRLLPANMLHTMESEIVLNKEDLLALNERSMRALRGGRIGMIFQEPMTSLNPVLSVKEQMGEAIGAHRKLSTLEIENEILTLLNSVKIADPKPIMECYPHQLSGGMKQRLMIAMALSGRPELLIADEPTTSLDVTTQIQILNLLKELQKSYNMAILFITHDLGVAALIADRVGIMCKGEIVEIGETHSILGKPKHPYTQQLIDSKPKLKIQNVEENAETVLSINDLKVYFPIKKGFFKRTVGFVKAVDGVSLSLREGETLALVGESGCGKTTIATSLLALTPLTSGNIVILGDSLKSMTTRQLHHKRSEYQIIFQDPYSSMDPRMLIKDILEEGMLALKIGTDAEERLSRMDVVLEQVGLKPEHKYRYPHEFSGGQRQRICIARALSVGPRIIVCDEPTSSLDVIYQAQIIDLLIRLQQEFELAYLFITHNFSVVRALAHNVAVMKEGKIVEYGETKTVLNMPKDTYTQVLLSAVL